MPKVQKDKVPKNHDSVLIAMQAGITMDPSITDTVRGMRLRALMALKSELAEFQKHGYLPKLLTSIAEKKGQKICALRTKAEMEKLMKISCPHYNGASFYTDDTHILEEELIMWSETSLKSPLNDVGYRRYAEVFRELFPEESHCFSLFEK